MAQLPTAATVIDFDIPAGQLANALDRFSEQSGLQIIYDEALVKGRQVPSTSGPMQAGDVLNRLLDSSGLIWGLVNNKTIAIRQKTDTTNRIAEPMTSQVAERPSQAGDGETVILSSIEVVGDPRRVLPNEASSASFGFNKLLLDTPRSVSFISTEEIDLFGLSAVEDLVRLVPGTYTPTRFGIQGGVDVRNVPADTFFRGMKRLNLQGHAPSVLAAMDSIEIVRGPPSPIYGMGKIGGYTNMVPRTGRAKDGQYLDEARGFVQGIIGDYDHTEFSAGVRGPLSVLDHSGGYSLYGLVENADTYARGVPIKAELGQAAFSLDNVAGPFRLEAGINVQSSATSGALLGRVTQDVIDTGRYIRGTPLVNLDLNGNGTIGFLETNAASPTQGNLSISNQPLQQRWNWPLDANGKPLPLDQFPNVPGIPASMVDYLKQHPEADPSGLLLAQGSGGPSPASGYVPVGFVLDPRTVGYDELDLRRFAAYERDLEARFVTLFADLIYDSDPRFTVKNQLFFDSMDQYKISEQPFGTKQAPQVWEDKLTVTRQLTDTPSWLRLNNLASFNIRDTRSPSSQCFGDFSTHRTDAMAATWSDTRGGMTPNTTFTTCVVNSDLYNDGFPYTNIGKTSLTEFGAGLLFDIDLFDRTNLLVGGRFDRSHAANTEYAGAFNVATGTSKNPGAFLARTHEEGWDQGASWSFSISHRLPYNVRPYFTIAQSSLTLDNNANRLSNAVIELGHIGQSRLTEGGIKGSLFGDTLFFSSALYEQRRINVEGPDDPSITAEVSSTVTTGWENELKWVPFKNFFTSFYTLTQKTVYEPNRGGNIVVDARTLGYQDVVDPQTGQVIYPAEAFLFGGRALLTLPPGMEQYREKQGNPNTQMGLSLNLQLDSGLGFTFGGNYFSSVSAGRLQIIELPSALVFNSGVFYDFHRLQLKVDVFNLTDERYFRARNGDTLAELPVSAMPERRWQFTLRSTF